MVAQDLFEILKNKNGAKGTDTAALNFKQSPTQDDLSKLHLDDVRLLNSIARDGTPDRAIDRLNSLQTASYEDRDLGEDELRTLADRMQLLSDDAGWAHIIDILSPALPDDISRSDLDDNDISLLDLKGLDPLSRDGVFEMVRESKTVVPLTRLRGWTARAMTATLIGSLIISTRWSSIVRACRSRIGTHGS